MYPGVHAQTMGDKVAILRPATGESLTYKQLDDRSNQVAQLLYAHGLRPGDHVALFVENILPYFEVYWACIRSGLYFTPINHHLSPAEAAYIVDDCDAKALFASAALEQTAELGRLSPRASLKVSIGGAVEGFIDYETAIATQPARRLANELLGTAMLYSSGTTGRPKGIRRDLSGRKPEEGAPSTMMIGDLFGFNEGMRYLSPAPMYHSAPCGYCAATILRGGTIVMMDRFDPETALKYIQEYKITHSQWVPTMFVRMLKLDPQVRQKYDVSSLQVAFHAAAPCPVEVKRQMIEWWGPVIDEYYSSTESAGMSVIRAAEWLEHPGSVGRAYMKPFHICGEDGEELPPGEAGVIYGESLNGPGFTYHKSPEKTAGAAHPQHPDWWTVGDIGYLDKDGFLYLTDRKDFMIISGGVNIYPQQIESALALHPKLADVAVIGVPNAELGEEVKAVVQPAPGVAPSEALAQEIMDFVREQLGRQLTPRSVDFVDELPRLPTGKLAKKPLRAKYWPETEATKPLATV